MPVFRVHYRANGKLQSILISAKSEKQCKRMLQTTFKDMGFNDAEIIRVIEIEP